MNDTVRLGRVAGVQVGVHWTLVAMVVLVATELADNRFSFEAPGHSGVTYAVAGVLTALGLLVGVLVHELGHAVVARRAAGLGVDGITLSWMGGVTRIQGEAVRPGSELMIAGVGPVVSAAFGGLLLLVRMGAQSAGANDLVLAALAWLAAINIVLAVFNILPASPLDGGRVLHSLIWAATKDRWKATRFASGAGVGLGSVLVALGLIVTVQERSLIDGVFVGVIGWWMVGSARAEVEVGAVQRALDGMTMRDLMRPVGSAPGWITVRNFAEHFSGPRPGWVWLLESWGQPGYEGVLAGDSLGAVPFAQWDYVRPVDVALPISSTVGAGPGDDVLDVLGQTFGKQVIIVVEDGASIGAVLPSDVDALVRVAGRGGILPNQRPAPETAR